MLKAVIFDMDGTMVDTEPMWKAVNTQLANEYHTEYTEAMFHAMMGRKETDALAILQKEIPTPVSIEELQTKRRAMLFAAIDTIKTNPGLYELLDLLEKRQIKKAIATSTFSDFADNVLTKFVLKHRFPVIITGDQVTNGKPHPEIFLKAAEALGVKPEECLVLEDAQNGVEAAYNAGMACIAIPHEGSKNHDFSKAVRVISSMTEINEQLLDAHPHLKIHTE